MAEDTLFGEVYDQVTVIRDSLLTKPSDQVTWANFTYTDALEYARQRVDTAWFNRVHIQMADEVWRKRFLPVLLRVDSVATKWKNDKANWAIKNDPKNLIRITPVNIDTEYYRYAGGVDEVTVKFKFEPLNGGIEQCQFEYGVFPISSDVDSLLKAAKELEDNGLISLGGSFDRLFKGQCIHSKPILRTKTAWYEVPYSYEKIFAGETVASLTKGYDFIVRPTSVRKQGVTYDGEGFEMPESIENYLRWREKVGDWDADVKSGSAPLYTSDVAEEILKSTYEDRWEVGVAISDSIMNLQHPEAFKFFRLSMR